MKKITDRIKTFYHKGDVPFYFSLLGPLFMGTVHLISVLIKFDWIVVNYCIFCFLMCLFKVWQWAIEKYKIRPNHYVAGFVSVLIIIAPMMASFLLTILYRNATHYLIDWFIYAYATYGTVKMVLSIKKLTSKYKTDMEYVVSFFGLISALYTIQMMEFQLIMFASNGTVDKSMYYMQLFTQGGIFVVTIIIAYLFSKKVYKKDRK